MATQAQLESNARYHAKLDDIKVRVPKGMREKYKTHAESKSLNALIVELLEADINATQNKTRQNNNLCNMMNLILR